MILIHRQSGDSLVAAPCCVDGYPLGRKSFETAIRAVLGDMDDVLYAHWSERRSSSRRSLLALVVGDVVKVAEYWYHDNDATPAVLTRLVAYKAAEITADDLERVGSVRDARVYRLFGEVTLAIHDK